MSQSIMQDEFNDFCFSTGKDERIKDRPSLHMVLREVFSVNALKAVMNANHLISMGSPQTLGMPVAEHTQRAMARSILAREALIGDMVQDTLPKPAQSPFSIASSQELPQHLAGCVVIANELLPVIGTIYDANNDDTFMSGSGREFSDNMVLGQASKCLKDFCQAYGGNPAKITEAIERGLDIVVTPNSPHHIRAAAIAGFSSLEPGAGQH